MRLQGLSALAAGGRASPSSWLKNLSVFLNATPVSPSSTLYAMFTMSNTMLTSLADATVRTRESGRDSARHTSSCTRCASASGCMLLVQGVCRLLILFRSRVLWERTAKEALHCQMGNLSASTAGAGWARGNVRMLGDDHSIVAGPMQQRHHPCLPS